MQASDVDCVMMHLSAGLEQCNDDLSSVNRGLTIFNVSRVEVGPLKLVTAADIVVGSEHTYSTRGHECCGDF